ncbi:histone deacetylase 6-like isoform X1 [Mizuhopecten yessoensis]|uniref:Protein deacetylase HDAC6 n=1 Tax=Mizuhopecten yessoensis TaxID=6573 RepID=A0A210QHS9_MIZYE|nr:histone deacetylase 6-like isoform X1 [Mizuhopecten yessoensis]OWF48323.1 Histone deacetylase 6 [Mizuhopecten yessoensis]
MDDKGIEESEVQTQPADGVSAHVIHRERLERVRRQGRERKRQEEERKKEERRNNQEKPVSSDSENEDDAYLIEQLTKMGITVKKPEPPEGTGLVYDDRMATFECLWDPAFPEKPERITESFARCSELGLIERCTRIEAQYGTEDQVLIQHTEAHLEKLKETVDMSKEALKKVSAKYDSIYIHQATYEASLLALGSTMELMEQILKKKVRNGLAIIRPPGHHAMNEEFCGYCFFNQVAIAAKHAVDTLGLKRVLIVDWDVHHGQATQQMFYDDPRVLYFSIHRYEYGKYWPNLRESDYDFIGDGKGKGYNVNVPLNKVHMTDTDYLAIFHQILMPIAHQFSPDLVLVSSGYDAAIGCPEGEMLVSPVTYAHMTHMLMSLAEGRVCICLEGGYCIKSLSEAVALTLRSLLGDPCPALPAMGDPSHSITTTILNVIKVLQPYWNCFSYQTELALEESCPYEEVNDMPPKPGMPFVTEENKPKEYTIMYEYEDGVEEEYIIQHKFDAVIDQLIADTSLAVPPNKTCIVYDEGMRVHHAITFRGHPEDPDRVTCIFDKHAEWGLLDRCLRVQSRLATDGETQAIHSSSYLEQMQASAELPPMELRNLQHSFNSIYMCPESNVCARMAAGCVLSVTEAVLSGQAKSGVAVVRPPGHHAECTKAMGFCFFNSVAIAAKYAQNKFGLKRVLILDWDVHHGNGTQHSFYDDPSILFISLHRFDHGSFYPTSTDGNHNMTGSGAGKGFNVNIPFNEGPKGDAEYKAAFQQIVMPIAYEFAPELVLVSAGFDAALGDPLGGYHITPAGYGHMTHMLSSLANGRVVLALEGGYNLSSISNSMATCTSVLLGDPCPYLPYVQPQESAVKGINNTLDSHKQFWKCLKFRESIPDLRCKEGEGEPEGIEEQKEEEKFKKNIEELSKKMTSVSVYDRAAQSPEEAKSANKSEPEVTTQATSTNDKDSGSVGDATPTTSETKPSVTETTPTPSKSSDTMEDQGAVGGAASMAVGGSSVGGAGTPLNEMMGAVGGADNLLQALTVAQALEDMGVERMYAVQPLTWCPHLQTVQPLPQGILDTRAPCQDCGNEGENWICLVCYKVFCSRYVNEHMVIHGATEQHLVTLSFSDLSVWCYGCDNYIDNQVVNAAKRAAHRHKFGTEMSGS